MDHEPKMNRRIAAAIVATLLCLPSLRAADNAFVRELKRYGRDAKGMALAPAHWDRGRWIRFGEGTAAVAALYAADRTLYRDVQNARSSFTNDVAKAVTPFGGRRAENVSLLLIGAGAGLHDDNLRDAGRDSLEAELIAGGIVTPLLKRAFGRARPSQEEGASSFTPFSSAHESFPSGHATNAFAFATAIAAHYDRPYVPTLMYTLATAVAFSRVNDRGRARRGAHRTRRREECRPSQCQAPHRDVVRRTGSDARQGRSDGASPPLRPRLQVP
jgi:hypothetical protein